MDKTSFRFSNLLSAMKWYDKREVYMLFTFHTEEFVETSLSRNDKKKSKCTADYNGLMRNGQNAITNIIHSQRKNIKWYKKINDKILSTINSTFKSRK